MPSVGTSTRRGRGRPRGGGRTLTGNPRRFRQTVKKLSSRKQAYKKSVKNQMSMRRAPIVETKQRVSSDIATINGFAPVDPDSPVHSDFYVQPVNFRPIIPQDAFEFIPLDSFYRNSHGFEEYNCIGSSIFSKFVKLKLQVRFPDNSMIHLPVPDAEQPAPGATYQVANRMIEQPTKLYMICGWVTQNWNCPIDGSTNAVPVAGARPSRDSATQEQLKEYIIRQLEPYFDDSTDKLMFREKETSNIKIDKYVRIKPNTTTQIATQAVPQSLQNHSGGGAMSTAHTLTVVPSQGSIPDVNRSWTAKTGRKIHLTEGTDVAGPNDKQNLYPNHSWLPFCCLYNPDWKRQADQFISGQGAEQYRFTQVQAIQYRFNDCHYFTDS